MGGSDSKQEKAIQDHILDMPNNQDSQMLPQASGNSKKKDKSKKGSPRNEEPSPPASKIVNQGDDNNNNNKRDSNTSNKAAPVKKLRFENYDAQQSASPAVGAGKRTSQAEIVQEKLKQLVIQKNSNNSSSSSAKQLRLSQSGRVRIACYVDDMRFHRKKKHIVHLRSCWDKVELSLGWQYRRADNHIEFVIVEEKVTVNQKFERPSASHEIRFITSLTGEYMGITNSDVLLEEMKIHCPRTSAKDRFFMEDLEQQVSTLWSCICPVARSTLTQDSSSGLLKSEWKQEISPEELAELLGERNILNIQRIDMEGDPWEVRSDSEDDNSSRLKTGIQQSRSNKVIEDSHQQFSNGVKYFVEDCEDLGSFAFLARGSSRTKLVEFVNSTSLRIQLAVQLFLFMVQHQQISAKQRQLVQRQLISMRNQKEKSKHDMDYQIQQILY